MPSDRAGNIAIRESIIEGVRWVEHNHLPMPCCVEAMLAAIPIGYMKTDDGWQKLELTDAE